MLLLRPVSAGWFASALVTTIALFSVGVSAQIEIPLTLEESTQQTYEAVLQVAVGSLSSLPIKFDTGSVGLELFATPGIPGNGTTCSSQTFSISYGNPKRVTYTGVFCNGTMNFSGYISTPNIPFGLLTATTYCEPGYQCNTPQENYAAGYYGVFGAGIFSDPSVNLPNPLRTLPAPYGESFLVRLSTSLIQPSLLILAPTWNYGAAVFPQGEETYQSVGALLLPDYAEGPGNVQLSEQPTTATPVVVFDSGNPVPWFHATIPNLPTVVGSNGDTYVAPGIMIGAAPRLGGPSGVIVIASSSYAGEFPYANQSENLINLGIEAFLGNDVIYDGEQGVIAIAPTPPGN